MLRRRSRPGARDPTVTPRPKPGAVAGRTAAATSRPDRNHVTVAGRTSANRARSRRLLLTQIERIQAINQLAAVTPEAVEAARDALLIGR